MSDSGGGGIQQASEMVTQTAREVAADVKDAVGEMVEQGVQSVTGGQPLDPQQVQQKEQERQKNLVETRRRIEWLKQVAQEQKQVAQENKQKEMQRLQAQQQEEQVEEMKEVQKKKAPANPLDMVGKPEKKGGVGG